MSFWKRFQKFLGSEDEATPPRDAATDAGASASTSELSASAISRGGKSPRAAPVEEDDAELARLRRTGASDGPSVTEAIEVLRRVRGTVREAEAVRHALAAPGAPEALRLACAELLAARGEEAEAVKVLEGARAAAGLLLLADLQAQLGQIARAVGTVERVLALDIDAPGARERHERLRDLLGRPAEPVRRVDEATVLAARPRDTSFRVVREVARGGAGTIYEAVDTLLGRRVALKVYHGQGADAAVVEREARLAICVEGPGVVRVYDANPSQGWVALEWIGRGSLREMLRADRVDRASLERWAPSLVRALARVHQLGLVHGDVKPANVLMRQPDDPLLGDFGLAHPPGAVVRGGSPGYLSPERLAGAPIQPTDDVYGFGRVLEDFLAKTAGDLDSAELEPWRELATRCLATAAERPRDAGEIAALLPVWAPPEGRGV